MAEYLQACHNVFSKKEKLKGLFLCFLLMSVNTFAADFNDSFTKKLQEVGQGWIVLAGEGEFTPTKNQYFTDQTTMVQNSAAVANILGDTSQRLNQLKEKFSEDVVREEQRQLGKIDETSFFMHVQEQCKKSLQQTEQGTGVPLNLTQGPELAVALFPFYLGDDGNERLIVKGKEEQRSKGGTIESAVRLEAIGGMAQLGEALVSTIRRIATDEMGLDCSDNKFVKMVLAEEQGLNDVCTQPFLYYLKDMRAHKFKTTEKAPYVLAVPESFVRESERGHWLHGHREIALNAFKHFVEASKNP